ncbi:MAG: hypothetical protein MZW92_54275 [Comamonadaceae bacterium]|nr:hypothetical protein [Comamonadaceae bacterium]
MLHYQPQGRRGQRPHRRRRGADALAAPERRAGAAGRVHRRRRGDRADRRRSREWAIARGLPPGRALERGGRRRGAGVGQHLQPPRAAGRPDRGRSSEALRAAAVAAGLLELELTETVLMHEHRPRAAAAAGPQAARRVDLDRRLRHRLLVARLPAAGCRSTR